MKKLILFFILSLCTAITAMAQRTITGIVSNQNGEPLIGASVVIKGTTDGILSDADGKFSLTVPAEANMVIISFAGYQTQKVALGAANTIEVQLASSILEEVIVTAQGIRKNQREISYAYAKVNTEDLTVGRSPQIAQALSGKVAGLAVYNVNNSVDPQVRLVLRGYRSLTGNNQALIIVDGVQTSSTVLALLNPNDIENISILKGGQAAALYGSAGINGALVIATKKGEKGKLKVSYSNSTNFEQISFLPDFQDQYGSGSHYYQPFGTPGYSDDYLERMKGNYRTYENQQYGDPYDGSLRILGRVVESGNKLVRPYEAIPNIRRKTFDTGVSTNNQLSFQGGDETSSYYLSVENQLINGIVPKDKSNRTGIRLAANKDYNRLSTSFNASYTQTAFDRTATDFYFFVLNQPAHIPLNELRDWQTNEFANPNGYYNDYYNNPYFMLDNNRNKYQDANITGNFNLNYKVTSWLQLNNRLGVMNNTRTGKVRTGKFTHSDWAKDSAYVPDPWVQDYEGIDRAHTDIVGAVTDNSFTQNVINNEFQALISKDFGRFSNKLVLGSSLYQASTKSISVGSTSIVVPDVYNVSNRQGELTGGEANTQIRRYGYYADLTTNFDNWLILNGTFRYDATSLFYKPDRDKSFWAYPYYGIGLSFIATDALPGLKSKFLNYAKIRMNYNKNANDNIPLYGLDLAYGNATGFPYGNTVGITVGDVLPDVNLKPETVFSKEVGGEFVLFDNRITLDVSAYTQKSKDQVITVKIPNTTGFSNLLINVGETKNWGYEADLKYLIARNEKLRWDFGVRYSYNDNKVVELYPGIDEFELNSINFGANASTNIILGKRFPMLKTDGYERAPDGSGRVLVDPVEGYPLLLSELVERGGTLPRHIVGLGSKIQVGNFGLDFNFEYRGGNMMWSQLGAVMTFTGSGGWTTERTPHIFPNSAILAPDGKTVTPNTSVQIQESEYALWVDNYILSGENFLNKAWFIKLRDVNLSYTFPKHIISKSKVFSGASISLYGRNLITLVDKLNFYTDPEFSYTTGNGQGINATAQTPPVRQYGASINFSF
jgi:TonB-linked SusC/RagA family outer membrane protein